MNKKERKQLQLNRHYEALEKLAIHCGVVKPDGKKLSVKLLKIEKTVYKPILDYCNGDINNSPDAEIEAAANAVQKLFNNNLKGFFINTDPRGYALKIDDQILKSEYSSIDLNRDWGGYGLLAPVIDGN